MKALYKGEKWMNKSSLSWARMSVNIFYYILIFDWMETASAFSVIVGGIIVNPSGDMIKTKFFVADVNTNIVWPITRLWSIQYFKFMPTRSTIHLSSTQHTFVFELDWPADLWSPWLICNLTLLTGLKFDRKFQLNE